MKHIGSCLNDFLRDEDLLVESELVAIKRIISLEIQKGINGECLSICVN